MGLSTSKLSFASLISVNMEDVYVVHCSLWLFTFPSQTDGSCLMYQISHVQI